MREPGQRLQMEDLNIIVNHQITLIAVGNFPMQLQLILNKHQAFKEGIITPEEELKTFVLS
jgi:hypothetical protein